MDNVPVSVMKCRRSECLVEFAELALGSDGVGFDDTDDLHAQHCQNDGCHAIYIRGKNGWDCEVCGVRYCEGCVCDYFIDIDDMQLCSKCAAEQPVTVEGVDW